MNILIPNSWLSEFLTTDATVKQFADLMSLSSVSIERMDEVDEDTVFDIEITTNRPDLMSIKGIAQEASAVLTQVGFKSSFHSKSGGGDYVFAKHSTLLKIESDSSLVNRIMAVVMEVDLKPSPNVIRMRLERAGIRSINNVVDVTNYIMREQGHPAHVFDYDRLFDHTLIIRKSKRQERIITLDGKEHILSGNDIVAENGKGEIIDLLGIMGTLNSAVTDSTRRIVLFLDNNNYHLLRKTSMNLGIRTEAAILNEKGIDPELMLPTIIRGIELLSKNANAKILSPIIDIYHNKQDLKKVRVKKVKLDNLIGVDIPEKTVVSILSNLGFKVKQSISEFEVEVPTTRHNDIDIPEDIIEEVARVYGYHKIPNSLPLIAEHNYYHQDKSEFYWINKIKEAFLFWGYNEVYTYSMVSEELFAGPINNAVKLKNPLTDDKSYLRNGIVPSILEVVSQNKSRQEQKLFEIANIYRKKINGLPDEILHLGIILKGDKSGFFEGKGVVEQLFRVLGITKYTFENKQDRIDEISIIIDKKELGVIGVEEDISIELDLSQLLHLANLHKKYRELSKFPPLIEDVRVEISPHYSFTKIARTIKNTSELVHDVTLLDVYENKRTFRITFLNRSANLTNEDITPIRNAIYKSLATNFKAIIG